MTITLNGIEIELPADAKVNVSEDGKRIKVELPEAQIVEKIRVIEGPERVIEKIKIIDQPCTRTHVDYYNGWATNKPNPYTDITWSSPSSTVTVSHPGNIFQNGYQYMSSAQSVLKSTV